MVTQILGDKCLLACIWKIGLLSSAIHYGLEAIFDPDILKLWLSLHASKSE